MKRVGSVEIPQEAFLAVLRSSEIELSQRMTLTLENLIILATSGCSCCSASTRRALVRPTTTTRNRPAACAIASAGSRGTSSGRS